MIERFVKAVAARLQAQLPTWRVELFPDAPDRYAWAKADRTLLVSWERSSYGELASMHPMSCSRELGVAVTVLTRSLHGDHSITQGLDLILAQLLGWEPVDTAGKLGLQPMRPIEDRFVGEEQGVWRCVGVYRSATTVAAAILPLSGAPLKSLTSKDSS